MSNVVVAESISEAFLKDLAENNQTIMVLFQYDQFMGRIDIRDGETWFVQDSQKDLVLEFKISVDKIWKYVCSHNTHLLYYTVDFDSYHNTGLPFH